MASRRRVAGEAAEGLAEGLMRPAGRALPPAERLPDVPIGPRHGTQMRRQGTTSGPVRFRMPKNATPAERAQAQEYVDAANKAMNEGKLSPTGRVKVDGQLKVDKETAAARERTRADNAGEPYGDDVAAHLPDTTWTGTAEPPGGWGRHTGSINSSLGSQSGNYPEGYKPTGFEIEEP